MYLQSFSQFYTLGQFSSIFKQYLWTNSFNKLCFFRIKQPYGLAWDQERSSAPYLFVRITWPTNKWDLGVLYGFCAAERLEVSRVYHTIESIDRANIKTCPYFSLLTNCTAPTLEDQLWHTGPVGIVQLHKNIHKWSCGCCCCVVLLLPLHCVRWFRFEHFTVWNWSPRENWGGKTWSGERFLI